MKLIQDQLAAVSGNSHNLNMSRVKELEKELRYWYDVQQDFYSQRAKENILSYDDRNTRYLHDKVNFRKRITQIDSIQSDIRVWLTDTRSIANELKRHFSHICRTTNPPNSDCMLNDITPCIFAEENAFLTSAPSPEEVKDIVFQM